MSVRLYRVFGKRLMGSASQVAFDVIACRANLQSRQEQQFQAREQRRQAALQAVRAAARSVLPHFPRVQRAYLFGSVLRPGAMRATSDVDVAVEGELNATAPLKASFSALRRSLVIRSRTRLAGTPGHCAE